MKKEIALWKFRLPEGDFYLYRFPERRFSFRIRFYAEPMHEPEAQSGCRAQSIYILVSAAGDSAGFIGHMVT